MTLIKRIFISIFLIFTTNLCLIMDITDIPWYLSTIIVFVDVVVFIMLNIFPTFKKCSTTRIRILSGGYELLLLFIITFTVDIAISITAGILFVPNKLGIIGFSIHILLVLFMNLILVLNGTLRAIATSIQLGIKWRLFIILLWWLPIFNIYLIIKVCRLIRSECEIEEEKFWLNNTRAENEVCKTKYPLLLVHGVFFRDSRFFNYWGRIPKELIRNGATVFYGEQQSAACVEESGKELAEKIKKIVADTKCEKVNIIAHSKGGLDSRYAISCLGMDEYVASLTTINTPHRGCAFAEYLLEKAPDKLRNFLANRYNSTLKKFGDDNPDFLGAVNSLTVKGCKELNEIAEDKEGVFYQSVCSKMLKRTSGKFPLNISYGLVKKFDGDNDGLVSIESAKWGSECKVLDIKGNRGLSHADIIDLNRENIKGFDIRELYVGIVKELKYKNF